jgi:hypothetical protein
MAKFFSLDSKDQGKVHKAFFDYSYKRNFFEAFIFYVVQVMGVIAAALIFGKIVSLSNFSFDPTTSKALTLFLVMLFTVWQGREVLKAKKLFKNRFYVVLVILSGFLCLFAGVLGGMLPIAFLTTRGK